MPGRRVLVSPSLRIRVVVQLWARLAFDAETAGEAWKQLSATVPRK